MNFINRSTIFSNNVNNFTNSIIINLPLTEKGTRRCELISALLIIVPNVVISTLPPEITQTTFLFLPIILFSLPERTAATVTAPLPSVTTLHFSNKITWLVRFLLH